MIYNEFLYDNKLIYKIYIIFKRKQVIVMDASPLPSSQNEKLQLNKVGEITITNMVMILL